MSKISKTLFFASFLTITAMLGFALNGAPTHAEDPAEPAAAAAPADGALSEEALGPVIRSYLLNNPEVVMEAVEAFQRKQEAVEAERAKESIKTHNKFLYQGKDEGSPSVGNPKGDVTIVEFFDYNCGYCKKAFEEVQTLIGEDKNVRVVFKEMPILSPTSMTAAQWSLAAQRQGKYFEFHTAMMSHQGGINESALEEAAKSVGLDVEKMKKDAADPALAKVIETNIRIAQELGVRGTPAFIINDRLIGGYIQLDEMKNIIAEIRAEKGDQKDEKKDGKKK